MSNEKPPMPKGKIEEIYVSTFNEWLGARRTVRDLPPMIFAFAQAVLVERDYGPKPIDMILHCPECHMQHIDKPDPCDLDIRCDQSGVCYAEANDKPEQCGRGWKNKPHRSHLCIPADGGCGHIWRPADVPTNGVAVLLTIGKDDS